MTARQPSLEALAVELFGKPFAGLTGEELEQLVTQRRARRRAAAISSTRPTTLDGHEPAP